MKKLQGKRAKKWIASLGFPPWLAMTYFFVHNDTQLHNDVNLRNDDFFCSETAQRKKREQRLQLTAVIARSESDEAI